MKEDGRIFLKEKELLMEKLLPIPIIENCESGKNTPNGFFLNVYFQDSNRVVLEGYVMKYAFPKQVKSVITEHQRKKTGEYLVILASYISEETDRFCRENRVGYLDFSGNCYLCMHSLYLSEIGKANRFVEKYKTKTIFRTSSEVSSMILRDLFADISRPWKLKHLAESVGCSIGQVSKVKDFLCDQLWADMTQDGILIRRPEEIMRAWSRQYAVPESDIHSCYTLASVPAFEEQLKKLRDEHAVEYYLTGLSGGVRYAPVVRYNRVHLLLHAEDFDDFLQFTDSKTVDSGANIIVHTAWQEDFFKDSRIIQGFQVASPVQVYLDCMQIKGRGEEMAEAVYAKEINK